MIDRQRMRLTHGGHKGAEAEFGRAAMRWDVPETTVSYQGHEMEFAMNVDELSDEDLEKGHVSMEFVFQALGRRFARGKGLRRVIYSMFHVVTRGDELFVVGWIQPDTHVRGGTGWGVELAKFFNRPVHVFDQERDEWMSWDGQRWRPSEPRLPDGPFSATGTRTLTDAGRRAIADLFERSLGSRESDDAR
ncbi:MAG TPA: hypothetical protein VD788_06435 [Candidatus Polarisedimenticolaceae bacterium]|nr:hypothetical protein [Candidatus Polarisedimenticolaceae bacterium]